MTVDSLSKPPEEKEFKEYSGFHIVAGVLMLVALAVLGLFMGWKLVTYLATASAQTTSTEEIIITTLPEVPPPYDPALLEGVTVTPDGTELQVTIPLRISAVRDLSASEYKGTPTEKLNASLLDGRLRYISDQLNTLIGVCATR